MKIAYLYPAYNNKNGDYSDYLHCDVGCGRGNFNWLDSNYLNYYINTQDDPDLLHYMGIYYKYNGNRKASLSTLEIYLDTRELINKRVTTTNEQPNLLQLYIEFRDSDILEGVDVDILLKFLYFINKRNLEDKVFNTATRSSRIEELRKMYNYYRKDTRCSSCIKNNEEECGCE